MFVPFVRKRLVREVDDMGTVICIITFTIPCGTFTSIPVNDLEDAMSRVRKCQLSSTQRRKELDVPKSCPDVPSGSMSAGELIAGSAAGTAGTSTSLQHLLPSCPIEVLSTSAAEGAESAVVVGTAAAAEESFTDPSLPPMFRCEQGLYYTSLEVEPITPPQPVLSAVITPEFEFVVPPGAESSSSQSLLTSTASTGQRCR